MTLERLWTLTLRQYERAIMDDFMERTGADACSKAEYLRLYPNDCRLQEWVREIEDAVHGKHVIPARVLDDVFRRSERSGWYFLKRMSMYDTVPVDYLPPSTRSANARRHREDVEMRRRVRLEVLAGHD